jgi:hypothetical protein
MPSPASTAQTFSPRRLAKGRQPYQHDGRLEDSRVARLMFLKRNMALYQKLTGKKQEERETSLLMRQ